MEGAMLKSLLMFEVPRVMSLLRLEVALPFRRFPTRVLPPMSRQTAEPVATGKPDMWTLRPSAVSR